MNEILAEAVTHLEWTLIILAIIIVAGPWFAELLRLPGLIGLVLGGLLLGPYVLGLLPEGALDAIGGIGLLFLMFMAGAELDQDLFQRYRSAAITFGLVTFLAPFLLSVGVSTWLGSGTLAAILMGSVWASHTLVAYPAIHEAGISGNKAVATTVGAMVITDTPAVLVLTKNVPLQVLLPEGKMPAGLKIPDKTEIVPIEPGLAAVKAYVQPGDVLVVPVAVVRNLVASTALEFSEPGRFTTLVIAASPHRLNIISARAGSKTESIINLAANP